MILRENLYCRKQEKEIKIQFYTLGRHKISNCVLRKAPATRKLLSWFFRAKTREIWK